jgi:hypothetical protein
MAVVSMEFISGHVAEDPAPGGKPLTDFIQKMIGTAVKRCVHKTKASISTNVIERPDKFAREPPLIALIVAADEHLARKTRQRELTKLGSQSGAREVTSEIKTSTCGNDETLSPCGEQVTKNNLGGPAKDFHPSSYQGTRVTTRLRGTVAAPRVLGCPHLTQA